MSLASIKLQTLWSIPEEFPKNGSTTHGLQATSRRYGYGRYFHFIGVEWDFWFGVNHALWARNADTPLWLAIHDNNQMSRDEIGRALNVEAHDNWIPIFPKLGVEYDQVVDDIVSAVEGSSQNRRG